MSHRAQRFTFGEDAEMFDRVRPSYPDEVLDDVVGLVGLPCRAVDAGCGTGKATLMLAARGVEGVGIEPDPAMAAVATRNLAAHPGWRVDISDFEDWEPGDEEPFDLVTCAQAWHWIDRERGTRQAERLLRPGGWLALIGRPPNHPDTPLWREIDAIYEELAPKPSAMSRAPSERVTPGSAFSPPTTHEYPGSRDYTTAEWISLLETSSDHRILPVATRMELLGRVAAAIDRHGGIFRHDFVCELWAAQRQATRED
jgi:SAM-dependent methyltransferase